MSLADGNLVVREEVRFRDCLLYLLGSRRAIQKLARSRGTLWLGALFVLLAGICREYDQEYVGDNLVPYLIPFVVSVILCALIRLLAQPCFRRRLNPSGLGSFWTFLALFWLTAPCAWILAVPVEEMLEPITALKANLVLLAVVSLWRVWLFDRVIKVLTGTHIVWPVLALAMPVFLYSSVVWHFSLVDVMAGGSRTEEQDILLAASNFVALWALFLTLPAWVLCLVSWFRAEPYTSFEPLRDAVYGPGIRITCAVLLVGSILLMIPQQVRLRRWVHFMTLVYQDKADEAVAYANRFEDNQFPVTRKIYPPGTYCGIEDAMAVFSHMQGDEKEWLRRDVEIWLARALAPGGYLLASPEVLQACPVTPYHVSVLMPHKEEIARRLDRRESIRPWIDALGIPEEDDGGRGTQ